MMLSPRGVNISRLSLLFVLLALLYLFRELWFPSAFPLPSVTPSKLKPAKSSASKGSSQPDCRTLPGAEDVLVVLKTGATEIYEKLPEHFLTLFECTPNYLIFSDLEQDIGDHHVYDALDEVSSEHKDNHADFELYRKLQQYQREGQNLKALKGNSGWNLDKWKFMPMLSKAYTMKPEAKWFVYIEADTSISWLNLLLLLKRLDSNKSLYFGAQNVIGETTFGHGGSGFVVSNAAAKKLEDLQQRDGRAFVEKWEKITSESCCGDEIVARAFVEVNVHLTPAWPLIQGETVATIDWTQRHWCTPAVTWHHVSPNEIDTMWKFQKAWVDEKGWKTPYLYRDVFQHFVDQHIHVNRTDWINISQDWKFEKPSSADSSFEDSVSDHSDVNRGKPFSKLAEDEQRSVNSFDECAVACLNKEDCKQYMWEPGRCRLGRDIRLGRSEEKGGMGVKSGWMQDRVEDFRRSLEPCQPNWKFG